jgi:hypothetical protein
MLRKTLLTLCASATFPAVVVGQMQRTCRYLNQASTLLRSSTPIIIVVLATVLLL